MVALGRCEVQMRQLRNGRAQNLVQIRGVAAITAMRVCDVQTQKVSHRSARQRFLAIASHKQNVRSVLGQQARQPLTSWANDSERPCQLSELSSDSTVTATENCPGKSDQCPYRETATIGPPNNDICAETHRAADGAKYLVLKTVFGPCASQKTDVTDVFHLRNIGLPFETFTFSYITRDSAWTGRLGSASSTDSKCSKLCTRQPSAIAASTSARV